MSALIDIATKEIGTKEDPPNSNKVKYNTWFYGKEVSGIKYPWCLVFMSWIYDMAGMRINGMGYKKGGAGCPYALAHISDWGRLVTIPEPGDLAFFDWQGDGKFDHAGMFKRDIGNGLFDCIEGNTSLTNDSNGGEVMLRQRKYKNAVFARPNSKK